MAFSVEGQQLKNFPCPEIRPFLPSFNAKCKRHFFVQASLDNNAYSTHEGKVVVIGPNIDLTYSRAEAVKGNLLS